jgi:hypothetical protein
MWDYTWEYKQKSPKQRLNLMLFEKKIIDMYCATTYTQIHCNYWSREDLFWRLGRLYLKIYTYNSKAMLAPKILCKNLMDIYCGSIYTQIQGCAWNRWGLMWRLGKLHLKIHIHKFKAIFSPRNLTRRSWIITVELYTQKLGAVLALNGAKSKGQGGYTWKYTHLTLGQCSYYQRLWGILKSYTDVPPCTTETLTVLQEFC